MSLRFEQENALIITREFLFDLLETSKRPKTVKEMKARTRRCLRHYPPLEENGSPIFSNDYFGRNPK